MPYLRVYLAENIVDEERNSTAATSLAVHLVSQVLDEACIIVNAAKEFGKVKQIVLFDKLFALTSVVKSPRY